MRNFRSARLYVALQRRFVASDGSQWNTNETAKVALKFCDEIELGVDPNFVA